MARIACLGMMVPALLAAAPASAADAARDAAWAERLGWGPSAAPDGGPAPGSDAWLRHQLSDPPAPLPPAAQAPSESMRISSRTVAFILSIRAYETAQCA